MSEPDYEYQGVKALDEIQRTTENAETERLRKKYFSAPHPTPVSELQKLKADIAELQTRLIRRTEESTATAYRDAAMIHQMADALDTYLAAGHREARDHARTKAKAALARWKGGA